MVLCHGSFPFLYDARGLRGYFAFLYYAGGLRGYDLPQTIIICVCADPFLPAPLCYCQTGFLPCKLCLRPVLQLHFLFDHCYFIHAITSNELQLKFVGVHWTPLHFIGVFLFGVYFTMVSSIRHGAGLLGGYVLCHGSFPFLYDARGLRGYIVLVK